MHSRTVARIGARPTPRDHPSNDTGPHADTLRRMRPGLLALLLNLACASTKPAPPTSPTTLDASAAWTRLLADLPGTWLATPDSGGNLEVSYRVASRGHALLETFGADPSAQTLSVYHPDGAALMLTHYCAQGNQVRLRASETGPGRIVFTYLDATNVDPAQSVMHELVFVLGPGTLERTEIYQAHDGARETSVLRFVRRQP